MHWIEAAKGAGSAYRRDARRRVVIRFEDGAAIAETGRTVPPHDWREARLDEIKGFTDWEPLDRHAHESASEVRGHASGDYIGSRR